MEEIQGHGSNPYASCIGLNGGFSKGITTSQFLEPVLVNATLFRKGGLTGVARMLR